jgi:hypothetical protein
VLMIFTYLQIDSWVNSQYISRNRYIYICIYKTIYIYTCIGDIYGALNSTHFFARTTCPLIRGISHAKCQLTRRLPEARLKAWGQSFFFCVDVWNVDMICI